MQAVNPDRMGYANGEQKPSGSENVMNGRPGGETQTSTMENCAKIIIFSAAIHWNAKVV